jgi:DNA repair exonuclease SbcCD ATPase subunit
MPEEPKTIIVEGLKEAFSDKDLMKDLQIKIAEMSRDFLSMAACYQEQSATLNEFMKGTDTRIRFIESNCNREERWGHTVDAMACMRTDIKDIDVRLMAIERAKCPKIPVINDLRDRIDEIETTHTKEEGWKTGIAPYIQFIVAGVLVVQSVVIGYALMRVGIGA